MKRAALTVIALVFLLALPLRALAVELCIRNEEQSNARVAIAYLQESKLVVEGWFRLSPDQVETIFLHNVDAEDVYIRVEFYDQALKQFSGDEQKIECMVLDAPFRYALEAGVTSEPEDSNLRNAVFQHIHEFYQMEDGKLWFNLSTAAG